MKTGGYPLWEIPSGNYETRDSRITLFKLEHNELVAKLKRESSGFPALVVVLGLAARLTLICPWHSR